MSLSGVKMDELAAALKKKDEDMRAMEDRYKMYLEKARDVVTLISALKYVAYYATE
jgi:protein HOOK1